MRKTTLASLVCGAALALGSQMAVAGWVADLPGCRGALESGELPTCRLKSDFGRLDTSVPVWNSYGVEGKQIREWLSAAPAYLSEDFKFTVRSITPLNSVFLGDRMTYVVQVDGTPLDGTGQLRARLWLADDQGLHATPLREWKSKPFGGDATGTFTIEAEGVDVGFQPSFLYVDLYADQDVRTAAGIVLGSGFRVENVQVGIRPTGAR